MVRITPEHRQLLEQTLHIAQGLGETFAPFCEVVVHDLLHPKHAILAIHNNLSGRAVGDPATELGLARIADPDFPQILANYANRFADGRPVKSTSIGIKDSTGRYIAALCINTDLSPFRALHDNLDRFVSIGQRTAYGETLDPLGADAIHQRIERFAAQRSVAPAALKPEDRRLLIRELKAAGCLEIRRAMEIVARHLGVSRATVYSDAR